MNRTNFVLLIQTLWLSGCGSDPAEMVESPEHAEAEAGREKARTAGGFCATETSRSSLRSSRAACRPNSTPGPRRTVGR